MLNVLSEKLKKEPKIYKKTIYLNNIKNSDIL